MNQKIITQCKKAIITNKKAERDIKLSLSDKCQLKRLTKRLRGELAIDNITFEEFVLLCKSTKLNVILMVESEYVVRVLDLLDFDIFTLRKTLEGIMDDIINNKDEYKYKMINFHKVKYNISNQEVILFEEFSAWCNKLNVRIKID